jgi:oxaloacetate decarboxylase alpha subunit
MEASNDFSLRVPDYVRYAKQAGIEATLALTYSISPKHTDEHFAQKARDAIALNPAAIYLKDPGGLLTPERIRTIVPAILNSAGSTPVELHSHCTTGLAPLCYLEAVKLGIRTLHTAIPPLANGSGQPSLFNIAENLRHLGYAPHVNEDIIRPVSEHLKYVAKREGRVMGAPVEYEEYQYIHQIPGGVISNLKRQLAQLKLLDRMPQVIEETIRVRQDFGYPIMVTPFSQYMATQAAINVVLGERYKQVADDVIYYAMGFWGKEAAEAIDPEVRDKVLGSPRAKELKNWQPPEPTLAEVRRQYGEELSDDELLLRYMIGNDDDIKAMRAAGPLDKEKYVGAATPVRTLIEELLKRRDLSYVSVRGAGLDIAMER